MIQKRQWERNAFRKSLKLWVAMETWFIILSLFCVPVFLGYWASFQPWWKYFAACFSWLGDVAYWIAVAVNGWVLSFLGG